MTCVFVLRMPTLRFRVNKDSQLHGRRISPTSLLPWVLISLQNRSIRKLRTVRQIWLSKAGPESGKRKWYRGALGQPLPPTPFTLQLIEFNIINNVRFPRRSMHSTVQYIFRLERLESPGKLHCKVPELECHNYVMTRKIIKDISCPCQNCKDCHKRNIKTKYILFFKYKLYVEV